MYTHVSMFRFHDREHLAAHRDKIRQMLLTFPEHIPEIRSCKVVENCLPQPTVSADSPLLFCDLIQIITFASAEELARYPHNEYHQEMVRTTDDLMERVCILDFDA